MDYDTSGVLSFNEACAFLTEKLRINDLPSKLTGVKLDLLNEIVSKWHQHIPFHDLLQIFKGPECKAIPNLKDAVSDVINGHGGLCWNHNLTLFFLLKVLQFNVYLAASAVLQKTAINHVVVILKNLEKIGDIYLLDVGTGYPTLNVIPLDFEVSSIIYEQSFIKYRFIYDAEKCMFKRVHFTKKRKDNTKRKYEEFVDEVWGVFYYVWLKEESIEYIQHCINKNVFSRLDDPFNNNIFCVKFPNNKLIAVKDSFLLTDNGNGEVQSKQLGTCDDIFEVISNYFAEIPTHIIRGAITNSKGLPN